MKKLLILAVMAIVVSLGMTLPASAQYDPMHITVSPTAVLHCGSNPGVVTVNAGFFTPGSTVTVVLTSDPVTLGTAVADATGDINATFSLPAATTTGAHTVTATGPRKGSGVTTSIAASITVSPGPACVSNTVATQATTGGGSTSGGGSLPVTGSDNGMFLAAGAGLLVAGGLLVMATRKRSAARA